MRSAERPTKEVAAAAARRSDTEPRERVGFTRACYSAATVNQAFPASDKWHPLLMEALSGIPDVPAGDTVWWHCDMIHSVAPVRDQEGWGNVMYIPAAPWCPRNERYAANVREAFVSGSSPSDFPEENYEQSWPNRFHTENLNATGRRGLGLA